VLADARHGVHGHAQMHWRLELITTPVVFLLLHVASLRCLTGGAGPTSLVDRLSERTEAHISVVGLRCLSNGNEC